MESKTKKKLATAVAGVAMVGAAVSLTAGTFSYFTDSQSLPAASVQAGHLKIGTTVRHPINVKDVAPGWSGTTTFKVTNDGTVPGELTLALKDTGSNAEMKDAVQVCLDSMGCASLASAESITANGYDFGQLAPGKSRILRVQMTLKNEDKDQYYLEDEQASAIVQATLQTVTS